MPQVPAKRPSTLEFPFVVWATFHNRDPLGFLYLVAKFRICSAKGLREAHAVKTLCEAGKGPQCDFFALIQKVHEEPLEVRFEIEENL